MKKDTQITIASVYAVAIFVIFYIGNRLSYIWNHSVGEDTSQQAMSFMVNINEYFIGSISFESIDLIVGGLSVLLVLITIEIKKGNKKNYRKGEEHGSARWGNRKDIEPFIAKNPKNRILLSETESLMINEKPNDLKHDRNKNILLVGGTGSGKTRYFVKPNLMQMNSSYVVTDSKGSLLTDTGKMFEQQGYNIKIFNLVNMNQSMRFNPMTYIKSESDILKFVDILMANTSNQELKGGDPFWENAEKLLFMSLIGLMFEAEIEKEEFNFETLLALINNSQVDEDNPNVQNAVDILFQEHKQKYGETFATSQYKKYKLAAGKTSKSILIALGARLAPFDIKEVKELTKIDELELDIIGDSKTIFYIILPDNNSTFNFLAGIMYSQLFNILIEKADNSPNNKLKYPIQMYLDEFANIGTIPDFEKIIATIRSRGISAIVILQSIAQIKAKYKETADTIMENCDSLVFLGGKGSSTLKELSEQLGKQTVDVIANNISKGSQESYSQNNTIVGRELMTSDELGTMNNLESIVSIRGVRPFKSLKIKLENHPNYHLVSESYQDGKGFNIIQFMNKEGKKEVKNDTEDTQMQTAHFNFDETNYDAPIITLNNFQI